MFFLILKNVTSERPLALMPTLMHMWEALRASEVMKWQQRYRTEWDAVNGRNGGAQRTVCEILMEMERFKYRTGEEDLGAVALVLDLAKAFEQVSLLVVRALGDTLQLFREDLAAAMRVLRAQEASAVRKMRSSAAPSHHGHLAKIKMEFLTSSYRVAACIEWGYSPSAEVEGLCGRHHSTLDWEKRESNRNGEN